MPERRVVITGLGVVTAAASEAEEFWRALTEGRSGISEISLFDATGFLGRDGGQLADFSARKYVPKSYRKSVKVMSRDIEIAVAAADGAFRDAGITTRGIDPDAVDVEGRRLGCNIGAGLICTDLDGLAEAVNSAVTDGKFDFREWGRAGMDNLTPLWLLKYLPNMLSCHVTIIHGCEGPSNCITCGDASGLMAIGEAARYIARGAADVAIAGGAESKLNPMGVMRQQLLGRLRARGAGEPTAAPRPFEPAHGGMVVGEGGGLVILEDRQRARDRGADIYAELVGFGGACDPRGIDVAKPNVGGLDLAVRRALGDAGIAPEQVSMILAHGTGVPAEDVAEAAAWASALGAPAAEIPAATVTGSTGSLFAGAGGVEIAAAALALRHQTVPASAGFAAPAADCVMNLSASGRAMELEYVVSGAFGVGGQSGACVLKRHES